MGRNGGSLTALTTPTAPGDCAPVTDLQELAGMPNHSLTIINGYPQNVADSGIAGDEKRKHRQLYRH